MKVLIAEDDPISRRVLENKIKEWGYEAVTTRNGKEAWKLIKKDEIRLAILDWVMPGMSGIELCRKIRLERKEKNSKYIYIILLTSKGQQNDIIKGLSAGADDYMTKHANFPELKVRLQNGKRIIETEDWRLKLANFDGLTNLWSRNKIFDFFEEELERSSRENRPISTIMVDIDHFKRINDSHGHFIGDTVLCEVASRLKRSTRHYDKIGRYGGDEMLVILPNCSFDNVKHIAEHLRRSIGEEKIKTESGLLEITISLGGASSEGLPPRSRNNLIQDSDNALYLAKKQGGNRAVIAEPHNKNMKKTF